MANAKQVSRHECTVEEVTSTSMTLFIPDKLYGNPHLYKPLIVRNAGATDPKRTTTSRKSSTKAARNATDTTTVVSLQGAAPVPSQRFTLYVGDCLIFQTGQGFEDHPFQVVAMATTTTTTPTTTPTTTASLPRKRAAAAPTSRVVSDTTTPRHHKPNKTLDPSSSIPSVPPPPLCTNNNKANNNKANNHHHKKTKTTHSLLPNVPWLPTGATPFICPFETNYITHHTDRPMIQSLPSPSLLRDGQDKEEPPPSRGGSTATLDTTSRAEVPPATTTTSTTANVAQADSNNIVNEEEEVDDFYYDNEDDDDDAEDPSKNNTPRDMHTTLGNTLQKALCESTTPTMGATLLSLTTLHHHRLPSLQLCQALIHQSSLLDCGSPTSNHSEGVSLVAQRLILEYFQDAVDMYPTVLPQRLVAAAGPSVWRTLLDLLASLPPPPLLPPSPKQPRQALSSSRSSRRGTSSNTSATTSPTEDNKWNEDEETSRRHRRRRHHRECLLHYHLMQKHLVALKFLYLVMDGAVHMSTGHGSQTTTTGAGSAASDSTNMTSKNSPPCRRTRRTNHHSNITTGKQPSSSSPLLSSSSSSSSSLILLKDMRDFGSAAACRLAASTMAHVLCVLGPEHLLPSQQQEEDDEDESTNRVVFHSVASDIMEYLGWMLRFMVQELLLFPSTSSSTTDSPMKDTNVATLLWNALSTRLDDDSYSSRYAAAGSGGSSTTTRKSKSLTTIEKRNLKIYWLECFVGGRHQEEEAEDDESQSPDPRRRQGMIDMEEILAAKLRITKEYFE
jgi:hypothetical protein